jgi:hypothetical protein
MTIDLLYLLEFYTSHGTRAQKKKMRTKWEILSAPWGPGASNHILWLPKMFKKTLTHFVVHAVGHNRATNCWIMLDPCFWSIGHKLMVFFGARPSWKRMRQGHFLQTIFSWVSMFIRNHRICKNADRNSMTYSWSRDSTILWVINRSEVYVENTERERLLRCCTQ